MSLIQYYSKKADLAQSFLTRITRNVSLLGLLAIHLTIFLRIRYHFFFSIHDI